MPRPKMFRKALDQELPRVRVSSEMYRIVTLSAKHHGLSISDLVRASLAHTLGLSHKNSELIDRMIRDTASSLEAQVTEEGEEDGQ